MTSLSQMLDPRTGIPFQRCTGDRSASYAVFPSKLLIKTRSAGKTSGSDGMRLDCMIVAAGP